MKRNICIRLLTLVFVASVFSASVMNAEVKVLEKSRKDVPQWVDSPGKGHIVASVEAPTLQQARKEAVRELALQVIAAVGVNIEHSTTISSKHQDSDGGMSENEKYESSTEMVWARLPFIKGISLSEAVDSYWVRVRDKENGNEYYRLDVLYPLSEREIAEMREKFESEDAAKTRELALYKLGLDSVSSAREISDALLALDDLSGFFVDRLRREEAENLAGSYRDLYRKVRMVFGKQSGGSVEVSLMLDGRLFRSDGSKPILKSDCAASLSSRPASDGDGFVIYYDAIDCLPDDDNYIDITLRIDMTTIRDRFLIPKKIDE